MRRQQLKCLLRTLIGAPSVLLVAILGVPLGAQVAPQAQAGRSLAAAYDAAHETTLTGTIQEVVVKHEKGSAPGMHLLIAGSQGAVDAHLGPYLDSDTRAALQAGTLVQIVGSMETSKGKNVLLARQLVFSGRTVTVRNAQGFLVRAQAGRARPSKSEKTAETESKGGAL
jgi:hypothetical protein